MPKGSKKGGAGKKSTPVKTREAGVNHMIREDVERRQASKVVKGGGRGGRRGG